MANDEEVFNVIKNNIVSVLPDIKPEQIKKEGSLKDLGANSLDRNEIIIQSMQDLGVKIPLVELGKANTIQELVKIYVDNSKG